MNERRILPSIFIGAVAFVALVHLGCSEAADTGTRTLVGPEIALGQGTARVEAVVTTAGVTQSLGIVLTESALQGLPTPTGSPVPEIVIPMPAGLAENVFNHATLNWQPSGHPPAGTFDKPHFDIHWYLVTQAERSAMTPADPQFGAKALVRPGAEFEPPNYAGDAFAIPRMGTHWTDQTAPEHHGGAFTRAFLYGFFDGRLAFIEPMVTVAFLQSTTGAEMAIAQPARVQRSGSYPTRWAVRHDAARREYRVELLGFVPR